MRLSPDDFPTLVVKQRPIWRIDSLRLLREAFWARYAREVTPPVVNGIQILFPQTVTNWGWRITAISQRLSGVPLLEMLYQRCQRAAALDAGMTILTALHEADVRARSGAFFGQFFRWGKGLRLFARTLLDSSLLSPHEKKELRRLLHRYFSNSASRPVLVHGDLHVSHVLVSLEQRTLGLIDLEAMHVGKAATNFAQLWDGYHYAEAMLGRALYERYAHRYGPEMSRRFDDEFRLEVAMRSHKHIEVALRARNALLQQKATALLHAVLSGLSMQKLYEENELT
jgi:aminoglycoside phosphotransferase (APT) family kinase protein